MRPGATDKIYVSIQLLLFMTYLFRIRGLDFDIALPVQYGGIMVSIAGVLILILAVIMLNHNLTPFPSPRDSTTLITMGIYKYIRHPIYTGVLLITAGYGVFSENTLRLLVVAALFVLFSFKARYEERLLAAKFPAYNYYKGKTGRFFPWFI